MNFYILTRCLVTHLSSISNMIMYFPFWFSVLLCCLEKWFKDESNTRRMSVRRTRDEMTEWIRGQHDITEKCAIQLLLFCLLVVVLTVNTMTPSFSLHFGVEWMKGGLADCICERVVRLQTDCLTDTRHKQTFNNIIPYANMNIWSYSFNSNCQWISCCIPGKWIDS